MKRGIPYSVFILFGSLIILLIAGCSSNKIQTVDDTGVTQENLNIVAQANNQFALDLYSKYKSQEGNIFFSPYSISSALAMTSEGAKGQTFDEITNVLHLPKNSEIRRSSYANIFNEINKKDKTYLLSTANALWVQKDYPLSEDYTAVVQNYYGGKVTNLDFVAETEKSRGTINNWVEEETNNKIKDLMPAGSISQNTKLILTNAIYFKGTWLKQFDPKKTENKDFTTSSKSVVNVPMMRKIGEDAIFNYGEDNNIQILEMPYDGEDLAMLIILPKNEELNEVEGSLSLEKLDYWKGLLEERRVDVLIPKFRLETQYNMAETLSELGMPIAFTSNADFTGINENGNIQIDSVIHKAFVDVNEEGTEAAAATGVAFVTSANPSNPIFNANKPFIFIIQQNSGNILFIGRVNNPV